MGGIVRRIYLATVVLVLMLFGGAGGYHLLGRGRWSWSDCFYHTVITLSTVGYGELPGIAEVRYARALTVVLIVLGTGSVVYFASNVTALIVEDDLRDLFRRNRVRKSIARMENHIIVCGIGRTGTHVLEEFRATRTPFVAVDEDATKLEHLRALDPTMTYLVGDATEDETLVSAGIHRARGVVAALSDDKANLYVTLSARSLNPSLRIVAKCTEHSAEPKLRKAGADRVVSTNNIGGLRLASEMIRPTATEFLDLILRDPEHVLRIEEATLPATSPFVGRTLAAAQLRKVSDVLVVATRAAGRYVFNPGAELVLEAGLTLIVLGERREIERLRAALGALPPAP
ncbi:MAG: potassium channel protein [Deltaproteobacteria bacterium]|nr:potassium channel protein [Deltaproteobacteria bacterium]